MSVLLGILKVLGIILLVLLCIILAVLLIVLLVPFRYRISAAGEGKTWDADVKFGWLAYLLQANVAFHDKKLHIFAKAFGKTVYDNQAEGSKKEKDEPVKVPQEENPAASEEYAEVFAPVGSDLEDVSSEEPEYAAEATETPAADISETVISEEEETVIGYEEVQDEEDDIFAELVKEAEEAEEKQKKQVESIWNMLDHVYEKIDNLRDKIDPVIEFLQEDDTQDLLGSTFRHLGKILKHILPYTMEGYLCVGRGDPVKTAKLAAVMSMLYPKLPKKFTYESDFVNKGIAADLTLKGRIRIGSLLCIVIGLVLKGYTIRTIKRIKALMSTFKEQPQEG